ncbi:MAG: 50S ribosomal protein L1 [Acidimicrobiia bacterium]|nr:50S ribosomal protein L1 [Acidimicrobiia bacterium]MBT8214730.1 50S ribosomal protein L1 [Acidimicrobiia bacterium]NNF68572.1 50S ribosomal protein L1 [Acidimicrobiia bacterium]
MAQKSKARRQAEARYDREAAYTPEAAVELVKALSTTKFDEGVDAVFALGIDPKKADENVRGTVSLPHGTGKAVRVLVFAASDKAAEAEAAGADIVGGKELAEEIGKGGALEFDVAIATPDMMPNVGKLGQILGPRGLMPNPKSGTVTLDIESTVAAFKAGRVEYRNDRYGNVHIPIGRVSFTQDQLQENLATVSDEVLRARPASTKGRYVKKAVISSTMGPGVRLDVGEIEDLAKSIR